MARSALRFRYKHARRGPAARRSELTQSGALFPWRTINGEEASAYYAAGTAQYHIDADIAYALCKYVARHRRRRLHGARGRRHPRRDGPDVGRPRLLAGATATARSFHIHGVTGPDEYTTVVNDNLFTNVMARCNLRDGGADACGWLRRARSRRLPAGGRAARASSDDEVDGVGPSAAERMYIPYDEAPRDPPAGRAASSTARCGTWRTRPRRSGRCCCTTTRW